jgi:tetratricopeptide (TPR) repeat protein
LLDNAGSYLLVRGRYNEIELLYQRALSINEKALGSEHLVIAGNLNNLAMLYFSQGQYTKAEPLYGRALVIFERVLGPEHSNVAMSLNNLAVLYDTQGQYVKAEPLYQRTLAIREKVLGPDHLYVAATLNNLAMLYSRKPGKASPSCCVWWPRRGDPAPAPFPEVQATAGKGIRPSRIGLGPALSPLCGRPQPLQHTACILAWDLKVSHALQRLQRRFLCLAN